MARLDFGNLAPQESSGLLPVANMYGDARLWANTEWAAWLLLDKSDFAV